MNYPIKTKEYLHGGKVGESDLYEDLLGKSWKRQLAHKR